VVTPNTVRHIVAALVVGAFSISTVLHAADKDHGHDSSKKSTMSGPSMQMHQSMMNGMKEMQGMKPSGNMDFDFAKMMRHPHMQGVAMSQHELQHGRDPKMRDMAQKIIYAQKKEIAELDDWLKANPAPQGSAKMHK